VEATGKAVASNPKMMNKIPSKRINPEFFLSSFTTNLLVDNKKFIYIRAKGISQQKFWYSMTQEIYCVGVDLGGTKLACGLVDSLGKILDHEATATDVEGGYSAVCKQIEELIKKICSKNSQIKISGLGIGVPGQIELNTGLIRFAPNLMWHDAPLKKDLESALGMQVEIVNDVRAATYAEWLFGAGKGSQNIVCLFVGTGIGGGIVSAGRLIEGSSNTAGEVGHLIIDPQGPLCGCGNYGCLEVLAGGRGIAEAAKQALTEDPARGKFILDLVEGNVELITAKIVAEASLKKDPLALQIMHHAIQSLTRGCIGLIHAFNPECLILSGGVIEGSPYIIAEVEKGIRAHALSLAVEHLRVVKAEMGNEAGIVGAAACAIHKCKVRSENS